MTTTASVPTKAPTIRFFGLDIIRLLSFVAIAFFHISLIHYYEKDVPLSETSIIAKWIEMYARSISFSGFTIVVLSSFLTGYSSGSRIRRLRLFGVLTVAWCILSSLMTPNYVSVLAWDIYPLYIVGISICTILEEILPKSLLTLTVLGATMLWIPFWEFSDQLTLGDTARNILGFADCSVEIAEWPILPWVGLVFVGYGLGYLLKTHPEYNSQRGIPLRRWEAFLYPMLLVSSVANWGPYYHIELGDRFSCDAYRQPPYVFWSHIIWILFFIRMSVSPIVNQYFASTRICRWISGLAISRKFWAAYILNYLLAHVLSRIADHTGITGSKYETEFITWFALIFLPLTELVTLAALRTITWFDEKVKRRASQ